MELDHEESVPTTLMPKLSPSTKQQDPTVGLKGAGEGIPKTPQRGNPSQNTRPRTRPDPPTLNPKPPGGKTSANPKLPADVEHEAHFPIPFWEPPRKFEFKSGIASSSHIKHIPVAIGRAAPSARSRLRGIVVHQTYEPTLDATLKIWRKNLAVGTHFIIDKNGQIIQTTSVDQKTNHVGPIRPRCKSSPDACKCYTKGSGSSPAELSKSYPARNLMNADSIGIETVRWADEVRGGKGDHSHKYRKAYYAQNYALTWLVKSLKLTYGSALEVQRHPCIAWNKQATEAESCDWNWSLDKVDPRYRPQGRAMFKSPDTQSGQIK